jgi:predicted nucleic acid-binding protein
VALLLDATVLIDVLRGRPAAQRLRALRATGEVPYLCAVTAEEVERGIRESERAAASRLFTGLRPAPLYVPQGVVAGAWRREFARRGITLSQSDCLIAAAALGVHATIATGNPKDFPMEGVTVEHWPVGA